MHKKDHFIVTFLEKARKWAFWLHDALHGGPIRREYNDIEEILGDYHSKEARDRREKHLENLLNHACNTTDYYKAFDGYSGLADFPVLNKSVIRENLFSLRSSAFNPGKTYAMTTSGSSGTPFTICQDKRKRLRNTADTIYFKKLAKFELGQRLYYFRRWFDMHSKSRLHCFLQNIRKIEVTQLSREDYMDALIQEIKKDPSSKVFLGYSSSFSEICRYLESRNSMPLDTNVTSIIAMSEALSQHTRQQLQFYFQAPVLNRYSNLENGILSMQLPESGPHFHINWASYYIEILHPDRDVPAAPGEVGRVVVTDLFNYALPMIRYDTGDMASMVDIQPYFNQAPAFSKVEGRKMDLLYDTRGRTVSTFIIFHLESYPEIRQFQLIQEGKKEYCFKFNMHQEFQKEEEVVAIFKTYLGEDACIRFDYVDEIPQLASGKRRLTVNLQPEEAPWPQGHQKRPNAFNSHIQTNDNQTGNHV